MLLHVSMALLKVKENHSTDCLHLIYYSHRLKNIIKHPYKAEFIILYKI